ncbi:hypothetical protein SELMODRAFT_432234 [Selaginella moellendorffii]|uniref:Uncharacterized protein n=1 Tax=Selaginella moellendorffii TaxID=88036 RepID=D8TFD7_SELML|nr:hypothetical protein SELMODRAFT_432234 [Selaginella moellendorffii]
MSRTYGKTPEEVLGTALDNDPKRLKVPAYYNEVVFVSPFAELCLMISKNRLEAFQTYAGNKSAGICLHRAPRPSGLSSMCLVVLMEPVLDNAINTWGKPNVFGDVPAPREGHSASLIGDNLFVFGGCWKSSDPSEEEYYNDLHVLNTNTFVWKKISTTGVSPIPRDSYTCSCYKNCFVAMGGEDGGNPETMAWRESDATFWRLSSIETLSTNTIIKLYRGHRMYCFLP